MTGTLLNMLTVLAGGLLGLAAGKRLPSRIQAAVMNILGLFTCVLGINMALKTGSPLVLLGSLIAGTLLGEWADVDGKLEKLGSFLQRTFQPGNVGAVPGEAPEKAGTHADGISGGEDTPVQRRSGFVAGFVAASVLFCVGPMSITGSIQDGLTGDYSTLAVKAVMDGFASIVLASSLGAGVLLSVLTILVYQGSITLAAGLVQELLSEAMVSELTAAGGILILGIGLGLLEVKRIKVANMLPAIFLAPVARYLADLF